MKRPKQIYAGIDLHSNNLMVALLDQDGKRLEHKKLNCDLHEVLKFLEPYKKKLVSVAVESTFNWYWLVDGLMEEDYPMLLANPARMQVYNGRKHVDDKDDAFLIAELQQLGILPTAHIYDPVLRPVRDYLRRRMKMVQKRTAFLLSLKSLHARVTGRPLDLKDAKSLEPEELAKLFKHPADEACAKALSKLIKQMDHLIAQIEKGVLACAESLPIYHNLHTIPGVGKILAMTITMEVGDIKRFKTDGQFASYCRTVDAQHFSNGKKKADNNQKCGNRYLAWAFVEAANFNRRFSEPARKWYDRKATKKDKVLATKALACKLAKAAWHMMTENTSFDAERIFPGCAAKNQ